MIINFTRAFDLAWERMHVILFRPFDFGKWCAIGLSAFLAGFLEGGNGFNSSFQSNYNGSNFGQSGGTGSQTPNFDLHQLNTQLNHWLTSVYIVGFGVIFLIIFATILAIVLLVYWLGARGEFMILDNIVRNRGAIAWPWKYYERQANSLFGFYLLVLVISFAIFIPILVAVIVMIIPLVQHQRWPEGGEIAGFVALGLLYFGCAIVLGLILFIFREFGIPIMFRQGLLARPAFWKVMNLVEQHTGSVVIFVLLRIAIFIGVVILSLILCCVTLPCCCLSQLPYVGTVLLLPVLIFVRCFTLDCLAQFGPEYDVWTVDVPPISPPPPLG